METTLIGSHSGPNLGRLDWIGGTEFFLHSSVFRIPDSFWLNIVICPHALPNLSHHLSLPWSCFKCQQSTSFLHDQASGYCFILPYLHWQRSVTLHHCRRWHRGCLRSQAPLFFILDKVVAAAHELMEVHKTGSTGACFLLCYLRCWQCLKPVVVAAYEHPCRWSSQAQPFFFVGDIIAAAHS